MIILYDKINDPWDGKFKYVGITDDGELNSVKSYNRIQYIESTIREYLNDDACRDYNNEWNCSYDEKDDKIIFIRKSLTQYKERC